MLALIQRVTQASVEVEQKIVGQISEGILALVAIQPEDNEKTVEKGLDKILNYRIFGDEDDKMNLSLRDINGGLLLVSQFTLAANTQKGLRPNFGSAAPPARAETLYNHMLEKALTIHPNTEAGVFSAYMKVSLLNDGPVTFMLEVK